MHREELLDAILGAPPAAGHLLYVGRRGDEYRRRPSLDERWPRGH